MNQKDMQILKYLRQNSRTKLTSISKKTKIPVSTIFDKIKQNEYIIKYTSLIDFRKLGFFARANIIIKVDREDKDKFREYLIKNENVNSVFRINNGFDFMFEAVFKQIIDLEEFCDNLEKKFKIIDSKSYFLIEDLKREDFMTQTF
jgi:DNA-binding Lrp family transcriptional regulator